MAVKLASLVVDVAADISQIRGQLDQAGNKINAFASGATKALGALGIAFGATEIANFAFSVIDAAGNVQDMSDKVGISAESLQGFKYAAEQSGATIDDVASALNKLNINIDRGTAGTVTALDRMGLSFQTIRNMKPDERMLAITDALESIEDPATRASLAMELGGKSMVALLPAIAAGFRDVADGADKMSNETVKRLADAGDAWDTLKTKVTIVSGEMIAAMLAMPSTVESAWSRATSSVSAGAQFIATAMREGTGVALVQAAAVEQASRAVTEHKDVHLATAPAVAHTTEELQALEAAQKKAAAATKQHTDTISKLRDQLTGMNDVAAAKDLVEAAKGLDTTTLSAENTAAALRTLNDAIDALKAQGKSVPPSMQHLRDELDATARMAKLNAEGFVKVEDGLSEMPGTMVDVSSGIKDVTEWMKVMGEGAGKVHDGLSELPGTVIPINDAFSHLAEDQAARSAAMRKSVNDIANGFTQMGQIGGGAFGEVSKGIGQSIVMGQTAKDGFSALKSGIGALMGGGGAAGAASKASGLMGMVGTLGMCATGIGALIPIGMAAFKVLKSVFGSGGRNMVTDFAKSFDGGFDGLQKRLQSMGAEGEQMWVKLTQGVPKNDKKAAEAAIKEVQAFLAQADQQFNDSLNTQLQGIKEFGGAIPQELQPYLDKLLEGGRITGDNIDLMKELSGGGEISWKKMQDAADQYGISVGALGENFQRQRLHDGWKQLIDDAKLLVDGGADVNGMLAGMSDEISALVNDSRQFGTEIPENMRPYIESLITSGQLLDENGQAITDINSLTFGAEIKDSVSELIEEIKKLVKTLGGVPDAVAAIPRNVDVDVTYRQQTTGSAPDGAPDVGQHSYASGTGGLRDFGAGTVAMLHNREAVLTESQYHALTRGGAPSVVINVERGFYGPAADAELGDLIGRKLDVTLRQQGFTR